MKNQINNRAGYIAVAALSILGGVLVIALWAFIGARMFLEWTR